MIFAFIVAPQDVAATVESAREVFARRIRKLNSGTESVDNRVSGTPDGMKKTRRTKRKLSFQWVEENYTPSLVLRSAPYTGETKILPIHLLKQNAPSAQSKRPAA
jgi:hypothetical protein